MPLEGEYEPPAAKWVRDQVEEYEGSGGTQGTKLRGVPTIIVTSKGARSGKLRKNPVMRVEHDGAYAAVASKGGAPEHPGWFHNLKAHPETEIEVGTEKIRVVATVVSGDERERLYSTMVEGEPQFGEYQEKTTRQIPVIALTPA